MQFRKIAARITGLSSPVFGISWDPPEPEVKIAHRVINFLEDRRVLFSPSEMEIPHHCVQSILEIRQFLTIELQSLDSGSELAHSFRALRATCRKFLNIVGARSDIAEYGSEQGHWASWVFMGALGELIGVSLVFTLIVSPRPMVLM